MKGQIFRIAHLGYFDFADLFADDRGVSKSFWTPTAYRWSSAPALPRCRRIYAEVAGVKESKVPVAV